MARFLRLSLVFMAALIIVAEANDVASSPASSSTPQAHRNRKIGGHHHHHHNHHKAAVSPAVSPRLSPSEAPIAKENTNHVDEQSSFHRDVALGLGPSEDTHAANLNHHHSIDRSVAGGGVILGGLATTFMVAIIWYIRATRRTIAAQEAANKPAANADQV